MLGMAREAAAVFGHEFKYPDTKAQNETGDVNDYIKVEVRTTSFARDIQQES